MNIICPICKASFEEADKEFNHSNNASNTSDNIYYSTIDHQFYFDLNYEKTKLFGLALYFPTFTVTPAGFIMEDRCVLDDNNGMLYFRIQGGKFPIKSPFEIYKENAQDIINFSYEKYNILYQKVIKLQSFL